MKTTLLFSFLLIQAFVTNSFAAGIEGKWEGVEFVCADADEDPKYSDYVDATKATLSIENGKFVFTTSVEIMKQRCDIVKVADYTLANGALNLTNVRLFGYSVDKSKNRKNSGCLVGKDKADINLGVKKPDEVRTYTFNADGTLVLATPKSMSTICSESDEASTFRSAN